jgi:Fe-S oxidoreductase
VGLFVDTFSRWLEPENAHAAHRVLIAAGSRVEPVAAPPGERPLCCGRTFLSVGLVDEARSEARRLLAAAAPLLERGLPLVGVEPSCLLTLRDEIPALLPGPLSDAAARASRLLEEYLDGEPGMRLRPRLLPLPVSRVLLHGHCHQKAFGAMGAVERALELVPGLGVESVEASCCGMAGAFGYEAEHHEVSLAMAEAALLPAVRRAPAEVWVVADGTSCRHQIRDGAGREARHVARVLEAALKACEPEQAEEPAHPSQASSCNGGARNEHREPSSLPDQRSGRRRAGVRIHPVAGDARSARERAPRGR